MPDMTIGNDFDEQKKPFKLQPEFRTEPADLMKIASPAEVQQAQVALYSKQINAIVTFVTDRLTVHPSDDQVDFRWSMENDQMEINHPHFHEKELDDDELTVPETQELSDSTAEFIVEQVVVVLSAAGWTVESDGESLMITPPEDSDE
jgi:hypothetical protein